MFDYKKIFKSREMRLAILNILSFIPDEIMVRIQYFIKTGRRLHLKDPKRYTEKLQRYKLYFHKPSMKKCADKFDVREYVKSKGLESLLVKNYGVYDRVDAINWESLPSSFVIKNTTGAGGNSVLIVKDKSKFDINKNLPTLENWLKPIKRHSGGREWVYEDLHPRLIIEEYIDSVESEGGLIDYKFFCFNGKPEYLYVITDRKLGKKASFGIFSKEFVQLPYYRSDELPLTRKVEKPKEYDEMLNIARILSSDFPHARIDLYNRSGRILFGEITFFDGSGYMKFEPDEFDYILGQKFDVLF